MENGFPCAEQETPEIIRDLDRKRLAGLMEQAYFGRKHEPQTTPDEETALAMLLENPEVLKLLLAMRT